MNYSRIFSAALRTIALTLAVGITASSLNAQQPFNNRKASARAMIAGSRGMYDGTFVASSEASICGEVPADQNFSGVASFIIEYGTNSQPTDQIQSISFGSNKLAGKVTTASVLMLNISVIAKNGGRPYAYVLNTTEPNTKETGIATVVKNKDKSVTLNVRGKNSAGETIQLSVTCK